MGSTLDGLRARAEAGEAEAQRRLAFSLGSEAWTDEAKRWLIKASNGGDLQAMTQIGRWFLVGRQAPKSLEKGAALILDAAQKGDPEACAAAAVVYAAGLVGLVNWPAALAALHRAAELGLASAAEQLEILAPPADLAAWLASPPRETISEQPRLWWVRGIATPRVCDWLIERARGRLGTATVYSSDSGKLDQSEGRSNTLFEFDLGEVDLVVMWLRTRIAAALKTPEDRLEPSNVLHYEPGQRFGRHYDFVRPDLEAWAEELRIKGQRVSTALVYLNEGYEGGETDFLRLDRQFKGAPGDALFFANVNGWGQPDIQTLHEGRAPTSGEKWLFSQFVRDRKQP
jgi:prolyl 4-hydroxylase